MIRNFIFYNYYYHYIVYISNNNIYNSIYQNESNMIVLKNDYRIIYNRFADNIYYSFLYTELLRKMFWLNQQKGSTRVAFWWDQTKFLVIVMKNSVCFHQNVLFLFDPFGGLIRTLFSRYNKIILLLTL